MGIPPEEQPPHHYRLLGIRLFESNADVIANAADSRMIHLKTFQSGQYSALSQQLLNAVSTAKLCLLNPQSKAAYDGQLQQAIRARSAQIERPLAPPGQPPQPPPPQGPPQQSPPQQSPPVQPPAFNKSPRFQPPTSPTVPLGPSPEAPLGAELAKIGNRRVSSYAYRRKRSSVFTATIVVTVLATILGVAILLMTV
ncbi:MAG TPA: hypothetical protein VE890_03760 [Thermoguttaceae bacterium]|nr:hypothetical protein [Thermoguttaceae bacterium]